MTTDTREERLENLIVEAMTGVPGGVDSTQGGAHKPPTPHGGTGWLLRDTQHYDREHTLDRYPTPVVPANDPGVGIRALGAWRGWASAAEVFARMQMEIAKRAVIDGALLHGTEGQGLMVPALQAGLERRYGHFRRTMLILCR